MKGIFKVFVFAMLILVISTPVYGDSHIKFNEKAGTVTINYTAEDYTDYKVLIQKDTQKYAYNMFAANETFPLQMGDGTYKVYICRKTSGNKYRIIHSTTKNITINDMAMYTSSIQNVDWSSTSQSTKLAKALTSGKMSEQERFEAVYGYVIEQIAYDFNKADRLRNATRYVPSNDVTLKSKKGICYDYSSLTASMLRSLGIATKLVEGKSSYTSDYHAWNEVFIAGKWVIVDTTIDAQYVKNNQAIDYAKSSTKYAAVKNY